MALEDLLKDYLRKCFHTNFTSSRVSSGCFIVLCEGENNQLRSFDVMQALHTMLPDLGAGVTLYFKNLSDNFNYSQLMEVVPTFVPASQINLEIEFELEHNLTNSHDGWILDPMGLGTIYNYDGFEDLTTYVDPPVIMVNETEDVWWADVHPYFQITSRYYDKALRKFIIVVLPLDGNIKLLYYRRDLFETRNITVPRTWEEVLTVAKTLEALQLDLNNDRIPDKSFCFERRKGMWVFELGNRDCRKRAGKEQWCGKRGQFEARRASTSNVLARIPKSLRTRNKHCVGTVVMLPQPTSRPL